MKKKPKPQNLELNQSIQHSPPGTNEPRVV